MRLASPIQVIDYFHGVINGLAMAQMDDEDERDILAYNMIALEYPGMVATRMQHLQRLWRRAQEAVPLARRQVRRLSELQLRTRRQVRRPSDLQLRRSPLCARSRNTFLYGDQEPKSQ